MFDHYKTFVLKSYQQKISAGTLSPNLVNPTPAKVKAECKHVCEERFLKSDEGLLRIFFRQQDGPDAYCHAIKQRDTDTFKPLCNFLKGGTNNTETKNVELLAWLIDVAPRPYAIWKNSIKANNADELRVAVEEKDDNVQIMQSDEAKEEEKEGIGQRTHFYAEKPLETELSSKKVKAVDRLNGLKPYKISLLVFLLVVTCISAYLIDSHVAGNGIMGRTEECMYWDQDHYQPVRCSKKINGVTVYALDTAKVARLRKITRPDTLTISSVGSVWYSKIDGNVEFFTSGGFHPIVTTRQLKPVSQLIIGKYAGQRQ
ncbi:hypothetical protein [Arcticibacter sp.]|jgi:hypothetical protein|uniref:hypothetical protein n=1 Tax=Arcticibacter sp. TaxID=1872630 RepID=UPI00388D9DDA